jgi:hypothetical protein
MTVANAAAGHVRLIAWRKAYQHQVEPDPAEMAAPWSDVAARDTTGKLVSPAPNPILEIC